MSGATLHEVAPPRGRRPVPEAGRVVLHVFEPAVGGVPAHVETLATGLAERGWLPVVAGPAGCAALDRLEAGGYRVVRLRLHRSPHPADRQVLARLRAICREEAVLVHAHSTKAGFLAARLARSGERTVFTPHAWLTQRARWRGERAVYRLFERYSTGHHDAVVAVSESERNEAIRHRIARARTVRVVRNGIPPVAAAPSRREARRRLGLPLEGVVAAWVGRNARQKAPLDVARLARELQGEVHVAALGSGLPGSPEGAAIAAAGGTVLPETSDVVELYAASDLLVSSSAWEGLPLAVLEAMRAGLPVVAYAVGGIPEQVDDGRNGRLVAPGDVDAPAQTARAVAADRPGRERMGRTARMRWENEFTLERMLDEMEVVYEDALAHSL